MNRWKTDLPVEMRRALAEAERQRKEDWKKVYGSKHRCFYCARALNEDPPCRANIGRRTIDHVIPVCRSGPNAPANYVFACDQCNGMKGQLTLEEFREALRVITGKPIVFYGERQGGHWVAPQPLVRVSMRKPMIYQMERAVIERFSPFISPNA